MATNINYFKEFLHSKFHMWFAAGTVGLAFISASLLWLILGVLVYVLGLMFIHDMPFFKKMVDKKYEEIDNAANKEKMEQFKRQRDDKLNSLTSDRANKYWTLSNVCKDIESSTSDNNNEDDSGRLRKLDELMWAYLKLLSIDQSVNVFLENERKDSVENEIASVTQKIESIKADAEKCKDNQKLYDGKQRLISSCLERLDVLSKRKERVDQAKYNVDLIKLEQEKLEEQVKLLRADIVATRNPEALTTRIEASISHLDETNKLLNEMNDFQDIAGEMPLGNERAGFGNVQVQEPQQQKLRFKRNMVQE